MAGGSPDRGDPVLSTEAEQYPFQSSRALDADPGGTMGPSEDSTMISMYRCRLENDQWTRVECHHAGRGFAMKSEAVEYAEALNARTWPKFDWLSDPVEAYLAIRIKAQVSSLRG